MSDLNQLIQQIDSVSTKQQLSHAYLIVGNQQSSNQEIAYHLASDFLGVEATEEYSDLIQIGIEDTTIKIDEVRQVLDIFSRKSLNGNGRVLVIFKADNLNAFSYNALLKFIEEPAEDQMIILTTEFLNRIPETIVSRLQILKLDKQIESDLAEIPEVDQWFDALINQKPEAFALVQLKLVNAVEDEKLLINKIIDKFSGLANQNSDYLPSLEIALEIEQLRKKNVNLQNSLEYITVKIQEVLNG